MRKFKYIILTVVISVAALLTISAGNKDYELGKNLEIFYNVFRALSTSYVDGIDPEKTTTKAIDAMMSTLDPYTEFYNEKEMEEFEITTTGKYGGIGSIIRRHFEDTSYIQIYQPYKNSPAAKAGLLPGDKIISINSKDMRGASTESVSNVMKGDPGTNLKLVIAPVRDSSARREITIKRERISVPSVDFYTMLDDSVGYISLQKFMETCSEEVKTAILDLKQQGMKSLVLDLRSNGGGILSEAVGVLSLFVPKGCEVVSMRGRDPEENRTFKTTSDPIIPDMPLAVLVNRGSASASEIVSGAIQDLDRGVVIGTRTYGKGLVQSTQSVGYGTYIKLTTAKYYIPSGRCIQALDYSSRNEDGSVGVVPDSLITEFKTSKGRKVYDGGGIMPDLATTKTPSSRFATALYMMGCMDDYALTYFKNHSDTPEIKSFKLTEDDWKEFKSSVDPTKLEYTSMSEEKLKEMVKSAKREGYYDQIKGLIDSLEQQLKTDIEKDFDRNREEITEYLENVIITAYHFAEGGSEYILKHDDELKEAAKILTDQTLYQEVLSRDSSR